MADLTTLALVREYLETPTGDTTKDALINSLINRMSGFIERFCNRVFIQATYTEFQDGKKNNGGILRLEQYPIVEITSVHDDTDRDYDAASLIDSADYVTEDSYGVLKRTDAIEFNEGIHNIKVVYIAGYENIAALPGDLQQACIELVTNKMNMAGKTHLKSERLSKWGATYGEQDAMPASIKEVLLQYQKRSFDVI